MAAMMNQTASQDFGRWGQPVPAQEFGKGFPRTTEFGRWGRPVPTQEFGKTWPTLTVQQFGGRIPFVDAGWRSPRLPFPPTTGRYQIH
jgi:hypothetical protein